jgi:hypothetical protein
METLRPGSDEAYNEGCRCPVYDNRRGEGLFVDTDGKTVFWISGSCPIHGDPVDNSLGTVEHPGN